MAFFFSRPTLSSVRAALRCILHFIFIFTICYTVVLLTCHHLLLTRIDSRRERAVAGQNGNNTLQIPLML